MKRKTIPDDKQLFIFDMDGTIYLGENVFDCAVSFIRRLRENGKKICGLQNGNPDGGREEAAVYSIQNGNAGSGSGRIYGLFSFQQYI